MTTPIHRSLVALKLPRPVPALIAVAKAIVQAMTNNPSFPAPTPSLGDVTAGISALETAQSAARTRAMGTVAVRDARRITLRALLDELEACVQKMADADMENAAALIQSAGMSVRKAPVHPPRVFAITQGAVSGSIKVVAPTAGDRASYDWAWSADGGQTWHPAPSTVRSTATMSGLTPATTVTFRYRSVTKAGVSDWSEPTSFLLK